MAQKRIHLICWKAEGYHGCIPPPDPDFCNFVTELTTDASVSKCEVEAILKQRFKNDTYLWVSLSWKSADGVVEAF